MGMWGADDPFNRKPLMWKEFQFDPETNNYFQSDKKQFDSLVFNQEQYDWYQKLIKIRKSNSVLSNGSIAFVLAEGEKLAYKRTDGTNELLVIFNLEDRISAFDLPISGKYQDLLTGEFFSGKKLQVKSLAAMILKKIN